MGDPKKLRKRFMVMIISLLLVCSGFGSMAAAGYAAETKSGKIKIACVGDSLTEGYTSSGGLKGSTAYPAVLEKLLGEGYEVGNFGKTSYTLMKGTDKSYWNSAEYKESQNYDADIVVIILGTNDSKSKYWDEEQFKEDAAALVETYENLESAPEVIFAVSPQCYQTSGTDITKDTVEVLQEVQRELIEEQGWESVDLYQLTADREDLYHKDGVHFTDEGYAYLAECIYEVITGVEPAVSGSVKIPHTQTSGTTNYFTFAEGKWTVGSDTHTWSTVVDSQDPRSTWYEVKFTGNKIDIYSGKNYMMGNVEYFVDGSSYGVFDLYNGSNINSTWITTISDLTEGEHTFRAEATGTRNASGKGNLAIDAAEVVVYSENLAASMGSNVSKMVNNQTDPGNNSWVFTGGEAVQGTVEQLGGARNYIGHFEEYARSQKSAGDDLTRQRYMINTAVKGQTISDIVENWNQKVTRFDPRAVAYMVGMEDYMQGTAHIDEFKESLHSFIEKALAEKENAGSYAVIQKPFAVQDEDVNEMIAAYCNAVDEVTNEYSQDAKKYENIMVVDHFAQTKDNAEFKKNMLNLDGSLNESGHLEIGKQFAAAIMDQQDQYPCQQGVRMGQTAVEAPKQYLAVLPTVIAGKYSLQVTIPEDLEGEWSYQVMIDDMTVSGMASEHTFLISGLPKEKEYVLKIQSADGKVQLTTVKGVVKPGMSAVKDQQELNENQQRIKDLMEEKESLTWLFMGDSITHGLVYTYGYAGTPQLFEKFLKDDLGRSDDVMINTAVSGAYTTSTLNHIEQRLEKYVPDIVTIMLGTNDAYPDKNNIDPNLPMSSDEYEENLKEIIGRVKAVNPNAVIILRSPTPMTVDGDGRKEKVLVNIERMKKIAAEDPSLIYVDQYTEMNEALTKYQWLADNNRLFLGNWLHPGINGQIMMAKQLIEACGLWTEDSFVTNLYYKASLGEETSKVQPVLTGASGEIRADLKQLASKSGYKIGSATINASTETQTFSVTVKAGETEAVLQNLPAGTYDVEIRCYLTDAAKKVTFAKQSITIKDDREQEVIRLCGTGRYETAYAIADALKDVLGIEKFDTVVIATGKNFADALSGSYLASMKNAPILLTNGKTEQIKQLHDYIRKNVSKGGMIYILGGTGAVTEAVEKIQAEGYRVKRLQGSNRYETNLAILKEAGITGYEMIVATGKEFADSLSASAAKLPILLVKPDTTLSKEQKTVLKEIEKIYVIGGEAAVSSAYEKELKQFGNVERICGRSRYETSVAAARIFCENSDLAVIANGKKFPDGLCGGPLAAALNAPLILTADGKTDTAENYLAEKKITSGYVLGGDNALSDETVNMVFGLAD